MAAKSNLICISLVAAADLSALQHTAVSINSAGKAVAASAAGQVIIGILQNKPTSGQVATIAVGGLVKWKAGGAVNPGVLVKSKADGTFDTANKGTVDTTAGSDSATAPLVGSYVAGIVAQQSAAASGDIAEVLLLHAGSVPTTST